MAGRSTSAAVFLLVVLAIAAGGWFLFRGSATPGPAPGPGVTDPVPVPATDGGAPVGGTREAALRFLLEQAGPAQVPKGVGAAPLFPEVRIDALDALAAVDPFTAGPAILAALGGDGDPADWSDVRLHAAGMRIRDGQADGAETVRAYLKAATSLADDDATVEALRAAAALPPADGAGVVRRVLSEKAEELSEEVLVAALQAAAALGDGASADELRAHASSDETIVRGAAVGALLRLGDAAAAKGAEGIEWPDSEGLATGLGVAGNEAALPILERLLKEDETFGRPYAVRAVGAVGAVGGAAKAVEILRGALKDPDADTKSAAAVALLDLGVKEGIEHARRGTDDKDPDFAIAAWRALALAGDEGFRAAAEGLLATPPPGYKDTLRGDALRKRVWAAALIVRVSK